MLPQTNCIEQCQKYSHTHTSMFKNRHFYLFKFNRNVFGETTPPFSSETTQGSNILNILIQSLNEGTFISLEKVTIKEYAKKGGGDVPYCLRDCEYEGEWPPA